MFQKNRNIATSKMRGQKVCLGFASIYHPSPTRKASVQEDVNGHCVGQSLSAPQSGINR